MSNFIIKKNCLIILNGEISKPLITDFISKKQLVIIATNGASNFLHTNKIIPDYIIGDLDSVYPKTLNYFNKLKVKIIKDPDQEHSDFEKAINLAVILNIENIFVVGYEGKRTDHLINNFSILKKYYSECSIKFIDTVFEAFFIKQVITFNYPLKETISLIPFPKATGIKTKGLKYALNKETLELGKREGALNVSENKIVSIEFKTGHLLLFKKHFGKY